MLTLLLREAGVKFDSIVGPSSGEIAAAFAAGFISASDAIRIAYYRGFYTKFAGGVDGAEGGMVAVGLPYEEAQALCKRPEFQGYISVAVRSGLENCTLAGDLDKIEEVAQVLADEGKFARIIRVNMAYHSHHMEPVSGLFLQKIRECQVEVLHPPEDAPRWFSSVHSGRLVTFDESLRDSYWCENLLGEVDLVQAIQGL